MSERFKELVDDIKGALFHPEALDELLRLQAHELAEQIRAWVADDDMGESRAGEYGSAEPALNAADLIDPEVQR